MIYPVAKTGPVSKMVNSTVKSVRSLKDFRGIKKNPVSAFVYNRRESDYFPDSLWQKECFTDGSVYFIEKASLDRRPSNEWKDKFDSEDPLVSRFLHEIDTLLKVYLESVETKYAKCSLVVKYGQTCPAFHSDHYHSRLICSYTGPATEWTTEENVRREHLHGGNADQRLIDPNHVFQFETGSVAVMKGENFQGKGKSLVHRSAPDPNSIHLQKRVLLRIDH